MKFLNKYKYIIMWICIIIWIGAKFLGKSDFGNVVFWIGIIVTNFDSIVKYAKEHGIKKFSLVILSLIIISCVTAFVFIGLSEHFILSKISKVIIMIVGIGIAIFIFSFLVKKIESINKQKS